MENYVDVFISHKQQDIREALKLKKLVENIGYSCFLDVTDPSLKGAKSAVEVAEHVRTNLRQCKCLLYLLSQSSANSKWMPWELGFFDGRWGGPTIGLYHPQVTGDSRRSSAKSQKATHEAELSVQEFLEIYERVTPRSLEAFLVKATSKQVLANRSEVDLDRFMTLVMSAATDPIGFNVGCLQYWIGTVRGYVAGNVLMEAQLDALAGALGDARRMSELSPSQFRMPFLPPAVEMIRGAHRQGVAASAI